MGMRTAGGTNGSREAADNVPAASAALRAEIVTMFGFFPPFFEPALPTPTVLANLWSQTLSAYVNNPIPAQFKERLFAYLSRWCRVPYCIVCHSCALRPLGITASEALTLLQREPPSESALRSEFDQLRGLEQPLCEWPAPGSPLDDALFGSAVLMFRGGDEGRQLREATEHALGSELFQHLAAFLCYVRSCHSWVELHSELAYEADERARQHLGPLLEEEPELARFFATYVQHVADEEISEAKRSLLQERERRRAAEELAAERTRSAAAVRESERRFRSTFENAAVGMAHVGLDGRFLRVNDRLCAITGYECEQLQGLTFQQITHPADLEGDLDSLQGLVDGDVASYAVEKRYLRPSGDIIWVNLTVSLARTESNDPEYFISIVQDISRRKATEQALRNSEVRFHDLADNISQLAWIADETGRIRWYNQRWFAYTGTTLKQMHDAGWQAVHHPNHVDKAMAKFRDHIERGEPWEDTFPLRDKDGAYRWFLSRAHPLRDDLGRVERWFGTHTDVSAQHEAEEALRRAIAMRDGFLSLTSHELRTPLTALLLQLKMLDTMIEVPHLDVARAKGAIGRAGRQADRLVLLVEGLLTMSRIASGLQLELSTFDLSATVEAAVNRVSESAALAGCEVRVQLERGLVGTWDPGCLQQVVAQLLSNAIKYGRGRAIDVRLASTDGSVELEVRDQGIGIAEQEQERVFDRFERAVSSQNYGGLGIGLFVARQIVEAHGGTIGIQSALGSGATFVVRLPRNARSTHVGALEQGSR